MDTSTTIQGWETLQRKTTEDRQMMSSVAATNTMESTNLGLQRGSHEGMGTGGGGGIGGIFLPTGSSAATDSGEGKLLKIVTLGDHETRRLQHVQHNKPIQLIRAMMPMTLTQHPIKFLEFYTNQVIPN